MLNYLLLTTTLLYTNAQVVPTVKVTLPQYGQVINSAGEKIGVSQIVTVDEPSVSGPAYFDPNSRKGDLMCPVVNLNMVPTKLGVQIKPQYQTFQKDEPSIIEVFALDGVRFTEFFIQAKNVNTNLTVGHWRVSDERQEAYTCGKRTLVTQLDTIHWSIGVNPENKIQIDWLPAFPTSEIPDAIAFIGTFKTATGQFEHTVSSKLIHRPTLSLRECCEAEVSPECVPMCGAKNMVDSLSMATESCKMQIHKVQRCYLTAKSVDEMDPTEKDVISRTDFLRVDCCAKESIDEDCKPFCADNGIPAWADIVGKCQHTLRQVTNCWTSTSCVNRCNDDWRGDYTCQCDSDCTRRGDCCPDRNMACRESLPIDLEYWPSSTVECGYMPDFENLPEPQFTKKVSEVQFEASEEMPNLFGIDTDAAFAMRFTSYFFVRAKGTYKVYMRLGQRDTGRIKIDDVEIFTSGCSWSDLLDATIYLAGGGHQITVEFTDTGYMDELRIAYAGPDTLRKPTSIPYQQRDDILYMGQPPIVSTHSPNKMTTTQATPPPSIKTTTHKLLATRPKVHEIISHEDQLLQTPPPRMARIPVNQNDMRSDLNQQNWNHFQNPFHHPEKSDKKFQNRQNEEKNSDSTDSDSKDLILTIVILNGALVFVILTVCGCFAIKWRMNKTARRPYTASQKSRNYSQAKSAKSDRTVGNIDSEIFATPAPSVSQDKMLENIIKAQNYTKHSLKRTKSMKSSKSSMTVKTVDCGVGSSPPPVRRGSIKSQYGQKSESGFIRNASADSGIGIGMNGNWNMPGMPNYPANVNLNAFYAMGFQQHGINNHKYLPVVYPGSGYTDIELKSFRSENFGSVRQDSVYDSIQLGTNQNCQTEFNAHPETERKLSEIAKRIKSRSNSRAGSVSASRHGSRGNIHQSSSSGIEDDKTIIIINPIKPDDTEAEINKTEYVEKLNTPKKTESFGKMETEDELECRKKWHENRFIKNSKLQKSATVKKLVREKSPDCQEADRELEKNEHIYQEIDMVPLSPKILKSSIRSVSKNLIPYWEAKEENYTDISQKSKKSVRKRCHSIDFKLVGKRIQSLRDASSTSNEFEDCYDRKIISVPFPLERVKRTEPVMEPSAKTLQEIYAELEYQTAFDRPVTPIFPTPPFLSPIMHQTSADNECIGMQSMKIPAAKPFMPETQKSITKIERFEVLSAVEMTSELEDCVSEVISDLSRTNDNLSVFSDKSIEIEHNGPLMSMSSMGVDIAEVKIDDIEPEYTTDASNNADSIISWLQRIQTDALNPIKNSDEIPQNNTLKDPSVTSIKSKLESIKSRSLSENVFTILSAYNDNTYPIRAFGPTTSDSNLDKINFNISEPYENTQYTELLSKIIGAENVTQLDASGCPESRKKNLHNA